MNSKIIGGITVDWEGDMPEEELAAYVDRGYKKYGTIYGQSSAYRLRLYADHSRPE